MKYATVKMITHDNSSLEEYDINPKTVDYMDIHIRNEEQNDYLVVENILRESFWNLYFPGCTEHFVAHCIREHKDFIPELTFVLEVNKEIVGAIFYTHSKVIDLNKYEYPTITFGPVAILPEYQQKGLGRLLINHSINKAKQLGYNAIMICGYPYHYKSYNFIGSKKYHISMPDGQYYTGVMALPLHDGALNNISGSLYFSSVFEECENNKRQLDIFDQQFIPKEKLTLPNHTNYQIALHEIDSNDYL